MSAGRADHIVAVAWIQVLVFVACQELALAFLAFKLFQGGVSVAFLQDLHMVSFSGLCDNVTIVSL